MARTKQEYVNNGVEISKATLGVEMRLPFLQRVARTERS